uniref:glycosyltransferase family 64 protein C4-like n=1 Tax=Fragaria vesca subsp. vesca TaxID=101020 RepID=UPI0005CA7B3D|nr:PREDICTED: glycosyltransferase family 64 protein C4-like [Fragaria vesca subsp. vesca]XP_011470079.1 PREDICTED: glycosyltransferase family 64 protein C4-like [Fragaria vesca subsp. vesca]
MLENPASTIVVCLKASTQQRRESSAPPIQSARDAMVWFTPRIYWLDDEMSGVAVWWMGTYSMLLPKAASFHRKYLDLYSYDMPSPVHDYVTRERNCEDIAMSLLVLMPQEVRLSG